MINLEFATHFFMAPGDFFKRRRGALSIVAQVITSQVMGSILKNKVDLTISLNFTAIGASNVTLSAFLRGS